MGNHKKSHILHTLGLLLLNDWRRMWHERLPPLLLGLMLLLLLVSALTSRHHWQHHEEVVAQAEQQSAASWKAQPDRHPHRVAHFGDFVAKPLHPLATFEPGILDQAGHLVYLEAHRLNSANFNPATEATSLGRFQTITPALVVQWFVPLLLIMAGYATVTREKLDGTLRFMVANGISSGLIALAKWLALFIPVAVLLLLLHGIAATFVMESPQGLVRLLLMAGGQLLYVGLWCALIVTGSWLAHQMHAALLALLLLWVCACLVIPRGLANIAQTLYPTSPRAEAEYHAEQKLKEIGDSHNPDDPHFEQFRAQTLTKYGVDSVEKLPVNYNGLLMQEGERLTTAVYREQQEMHFRQMQRQTAWIRQWLWLSPALALQYAQMAASGSDFAHHQDFLWQSEKRRYKLIQYLNSLHTHEVGHHDDKNQRVDAAFWENAPRDPVHLAPLEVSQVQIRAAMLVLAAWMIAALLALNHLKRRLP